MLDDKLIKGNICPLIEPTVAYCHICDQEEIVVAYDTQADWNVCLRCLDASIEVDILLQIAYGNKLHYRDDQNGTQ